MNFTDQSSGNPTSWEWEFGNGNSSTSQDPSTIYSDSGSYTVKLIVSDGTSSDTIVKQDHIEVYASPSVDFTASPKEGCEPLTVNFTDSSKAGSGTISSWTWDFPGGNPVNSAAQNPPPVTYSQGGKYNVTLVVTNTFGCQSFESKSNFIKVTYIPIADFTSTDTFGCQVPHTANFVDQSQTNASLSQSWDFGDANSDTGANPSHDYMSEGLYDVTLRVETPNGCRDTITKPDFIEVDSLYGQFSTPDTLLCAEETAQFSSTVTGSATSYEWTFGGGAPPATGANPTVQFDSAGTFDVTLIVNFSAQCQDTIEKTDYVEVLPIPTANFTADTPLVDCQTPLSVNFTDSSTNANSWSWDFGDGGTSTAQNPSHTYTSEGNFNVSLTVTNQAGCTDTEVKSNLVQINFPDVDFEVDPEKGCAPHTVDFTDESTAIDSIADWNWDFDDSSAAVVQNPTHTYSDTGIYEPTLTVTTTTGCVDSFTVSSPIIVGDTPTVDFGADPKEVCWQDQVNFADSSSQNVDSWLWDFGDNQNANQQNPTHFYEDTGTYDVTLIATYQGCSDTLVKEDFIQVNPPVPDFVYSLGCDPPLEVSFTDDSKGADIWEWDFDDGNTSQQQNPTHTYANAGQYSVELTVTDTASGCQKTKTRSIQISTPDASLSADQIGGCKPLTVTFTNTSNFNDSTAWFIPASSGNLVSNQNIVQYTFDTTGRFDVMMVNCDVQGCCDTIMQQNFITVNGSSPDFTIDTTAGCLPHPVSFTDQSTSKFSSISSWSWDFDDGSTSTLQNPTHTYTERGAYNVTLSVTDTFGCTNSITKNNVTSALQPVADFNTVADTFCRNQNFTFNNQSSSIKPLSYAWTFGDGSPVDSSKNATHTYNNNGTYNVSLYVTDSYGCDSSIQQSVTIQDPDMGFFANDTFASCPPLLVDFTDTTNYAIPTTSWRWEFGDSTFSEQEDGTHIYAEPGVYDVSLFVEFANGCKDTVQKSNYIDLGGPDGNLMFNPKEGCPPVEVCFDANSTDNTVGHLYDFGDGNVSSGPDSICHTYSSTGIYHPTVLLSDTGGCNFLLDSEDSVVVDTPIANFGMSQNMACQPATIAFSDSTGGQVPIVDYQWDFGDGSTDTVPNPTYTYDTAGTFTVTYTVTNAIGCQNVIQEDITVYPQPSAELTASDTVGCVPITVQFSESSSADTTIVDKKWYFGDSDTSASSNPIHEFDSSGTFTVQLVVTDARGCTDTAKQEINVLALPEGIQIQDTTICANDTIRMVASQGDSLYNWSPGYNLSDSTVASPLAYPDTTTDYTLDVVGDNGCSFRDSVHVDVISLPKVSVTPDPDTSMCFGDTVELQAQGEGTFYEWQPKNGLLTPDSSYTKATPSSTTNYVILHTDTNSCTNRDSVQVIVNRSIAQFNEPVSCVNDTTYFTDQSVNIGGQIIDWQWDFGDGSSDTVQNPSHLYDAEGIYQVELHVLDNNGCEDDTTVDVEVDPLPIANFAVSDTLCARIPTQFTDLSSSNDGLRSWQWQYGDGSTVDTAQNPRHAFPDSGYYDVTLTVTDSNFCKQDTTKRIYVDPVPDVSFEVDNVCFGEQVQFRDSTLSDTILTNYSWDFGDSSTSNLQNPNHFYDKPGTYGVNLRVTDINKCYNDTTIDVKVWELPDVNFTADPTCLGDTMDFQDRTQAGDASLVSWYWEFGDNIGIDTVPSPQYTYLDSGFYEPTLWVEDSNNCMNSYSDSVRVDHPANAYAAPDTIICSGKSLQLQGGGGDTLFWQPKEGLSNADSSTPIATPDETTPYTLFTTNGVCPFDTAIAEVDVLPPPSLQAPDDQRLLKGDSMKLNTFANSTDSVFWEPSSALSCTNCIQPVASPRQTRQFNVTAIDKQYGCVNRDSTKVIVYEQCEDEQIFVPNTFTPNGDGRNDKLYVRTRGIKELLYFRVFDRWGELMYETDNLNEGWNGTNPSGKKLNSGVYVYVVKVLCYNNKELTTSGNVTIIK